MKKTVLIVVLLCSLFSFRALAQSSGTTVPPPPYCTSSNAGTIYTNTSTSPATVYTCSYYNLAWNWTVNPSYGGLVYYPTVPTTCSGALPAFLAGWPSTEMYVCVHGVPSEIGGATSGVTTFLAPALSWPSWLVPTVTNASTTPSLSVSAGLIPISSGGTGASTPAQALSNLGGVSIDLQTNSTDNAVQSKLNLKSGTNTTVMSDSAGGVTINSTGGADADAVHYNPSTATYFMIGDSRLIDEPAGATDMTVTAVSMDGTTITFTGTNTPSVGTYVIPWWTFSPTCLSGAFGPILTSTSTQVTMAQSGSYCTGTQTGTGGALAIRNYVVPALAQKEPFFSGHGTVQLLAQTSYGGGTVYDWDTGFSTLLSPKLTACLATAGPCYLVVSLGFDDLFASSPDSCSTVGTLEGSVTTTGSFRKLFNAVHQLGNVKIIIATEPARMSSSVYCTNTPQDMIVLNQWLVTLSGAGAETSGYLDYADSIIDTATAMGSPSNGNSDGVHYSGAGGRTFADALNSGMSSQGSWNLGQPVSNGPNALIGSQLISDPVGISTGCQLNFANNGSTTGDFCLQDYVGIGALQVAGNWASSWRWDSANSVMRQQMPSNGGYCIQDDDYGPYSNSDTCLWRDSANVWDLGNGTWKNSSGTLHLTNIIGQSTAPSGSCTVNGDWQFTQDGAITKCVSGTWTTFSGGSGSMMWPTVTGLAKYSGSSSWATPTYADVTALFGSGSCTGYLYSNGTCSTPSGSTSIAICSDTSGSGTAQSCTTSSTFTPVAGSVIVYTTTTANTGTGLTINVNSLGAKPVAKWQSTTTLAAGDIAASTQVLMTYDGTNWEVSTIGNAPSGGSGGSGLFASMISIPTIASSGFTTAWNQSTTFTAVNSSTGITLNDTVAQTTHESEGIISAYPSGAFTETILVSAPVEVNYTNIGFIILSTTSGATEALGLGYSTGQFTNTLNVSATHSSSPTTYVATDGAIPVSGLQWLRYSDDGTNVTYSTSGDGVTFYIVYGPVAKSSTYLGSSGYNYLGLYIDSTLANAGGTIMSLTRTTP